MNKKIVIVCICSIILFIAGIILFVFLKNREVKPEFYTITYNNDLDVKRESCKINSVVNLNNLEKEGYKFLGWYHDTERVLKIFCDQDYNLIARWEKNDGTVIVKLNSNGGTVLDNISIKIGTKLVLPDNPTKENYKFVGWFDKDDVEYKNDMIINKDLTLYAKWEEVITFKVTFDSNGGSGVVEQNVVENEVVTKPNNPTKEGYKFIEWQLNNKTYDFKTKVTKAITLVAKWEKVIKTYTITFNSNGGSSVKSVTMKEGDKFKYPSEPKKDNYKFVGWYDQNEVYIGEGTIFTPENVILYAKWEKILKKYTITFDSTGGSSVKSIILTEGDIFKEPPKPTKENCEFLGWYDQNEVMISDGALLAPENITLYAKWQEKGTE